MTTLPTRLGLTSATLTQGQFRVAIGDVRDFLNEALGSSGTAPVLTGASITNASSLGVGTSTPGAEAQITGGLTITDVATPDVNPGWGHAYIKYALRFSGDDATKIRLKGTSQTIGTQSTSVYSRTGAGFNFYLNGVHSATAGDAGTGGTRLLLIDNTAFTYKESKIWTEANDGAGSGLDADTLDGLQLSSSAATANTVVARNGSGDIVINQATIGSTPTAAGHVVTKSYLEAQAVSSTSPFSLTGGGKLAVMGGTDSQASPRGIFIWDGANTDWGIYAASAGADKSLSAGTAIGGISGRTGRGIRNRVYSSTTDYFLWENSSEQALMELTANAGTLYTRGEIYAGNSTTNKVFHLGFMGSGSGLDADKLRNQIPDTNAGVSTIMARDASGNSKVNQLELTTTATASTHAVRKEYVDAKPAKTYVKVATTGHLNAYASGVSLLISNNNGTLTIDGQTISNDGGITRVLVKNQTFGWQNGIYYCSDSGSGSTPWKLTRTPDADEWREITGMTVWVANGTTNSQTIWIADVNDSGTVSTSDINFVKMMKGDGNYLPSAGGYVSGNLTVGGITSCNYQLHVHDHAFFNYILQVNGERLLMVAPTTQYFSSGGTIQPTASHIFISPASGTFSNITLSSSNAIADGINGQILYITNLGINTGHSITIPHNANTKNASGGGVAINSMQCVQYIFQGYSNEWVQIKV